MATYVPSVAAPPASLVPVQLTLQLCAAPPRGSRRQAAPRQPYWTQIDLADLGGELYARNHAVRVSLTAQPTSSGSWTGYYDALFSQSGVSGPTRHLPTRQDALTTAAHAVARHCNRLLASSSCQPRADVRAAKEVIRWLELLDLL
jgi:hypothetical protein